MCVFLCADPGSIRRGEVRGAHGLRQTAVQRVWDPRNLQRHRSDSHERCVVALIEPKPERAAQLAVMFTVEVDKIMRTLHGKDTHPSQLLTGRREYFCTCEKRCLKPFVAPGGAARNLRLNCKWRSCIVGNVGAMF